MITHSNVEYGCAPRKSCGVSPCIRKIKLGVVGLGGADRAGRDVDLEQLAVAGAGPQSRAVVGPRDRAQIMIATIGTQALGIHNLFGT